MKRSARSSWKATEAVHPADLYFLNKTVYIQKWLTTRIFNNKYLKRYLMVKKSFANGGHQ